MPVGAIPVPPDVPSPLDGIGAIAGAFLENGGQLTDDRIVLYATGEALSVAFARGWVGFLQHVGEGSYLYRVSFPGCSDAPPVGGEPLHHVANFYQGSDPSLWVGDVLTDGAVQVAEAVGPSEVMGWSTHT